MSRIIPNNKIRLPQNFYLWGTMNPNDTSVQQIDSAFMRRWVTRYIGIDHGADEDRSLTELPQPLEGEWGEFRKQLNNLLIRAGCDEEELIGMWFLKDEEFADWEKFYSKLVFHLANNVLKMRLSEDNGIFIMDSVREIMKLCETNQSPFNPEYFTGSNLDPEDDIQSALEDEFPEANQEEIADLMAQIKDDYPLKRVIQDRKEAIAAHEAQNNA